MVEMSSWSRVIKYHSWHDKAMGRKGEERSDIGTKGLRDEGTERQGEEGEWARGRQVENQDSSDCERWAACFGLLTSVF